MITVPARLRRAGPSRGWPRGGSGAGHDPLLEGAGLGQREDPAICPRMDTPAHRVTRSRPHSLSNPACVRDPAQVAQGHGRDAYPVWKLDGGCRHPDRRTATHAVTPRVACARQRLSGRPRWCSATPGSRTAPPPAASSRGSAGSRGSACSPHPPGCPGRSCRPWPSPPCSCSSHGAPRCSQPPCRSDPVAAAGIPVLGRAARRRADRPHHHPHERSSAGRHRGSAYPDVVWCGGWSVWRNSRRCASGKGSPRLTWAAITAVLNAHRASVSWAASSNTTDELRALNIAA